MALRKIRNSLLLTVVVASVIPLTNAVAIVVYNIDQATVIDDGATVTLDSSNTYTPLSDANLKSFRVSSGPNSGTTYTVDNFVSGVNPSSGTINAPGFIQPAGHLTGASDPLLGTPGVFYTGSSNPTSYLAHGERGLSFSTGINVTQADPVTTIQFDISIKDSLLLDDGIPDFIFGDAADNQSTDSIEFLDNNGDAIIFATFTQTNWSSLGTHTIDRLEADGSDFNGSTASADNTERGIAMTAFEVQATDLTALGGTFATFTDAMAAVESIRITVSSEGSPKTDYAFFGINTNAFDSPDLVPEPSSYASIFGLMALLVAFARRRPSSRYKI